MAITADQDILASDFINQSEANGTPSNDAGRVPKLGADGFLEKYFLKRKTGSTSFSGTPTINTDTYERYLITSMTSDITSMTTNLSGTPRDGDRLELVFKNAQTNDISFVASNSGYAVSNSEVVTKPTGTADGDIMFAVLNSETAYANSIPSGWTLVAQNTNSRFFELYYKVASSEGANYTFGWAGSYKHRVTITTYRGGFNKSNPIQAFSNTIYNTNNQTIQAASISVTKHNSPIFYFGCFQNTSSGSARTIGNASGQDLSWTQDYSVVATPFSMHSVCRINKFYGTTGVINASTDATAEATSKHAFAVALNPNTFSVTFGASFAEGTLAVAAGQTVIRNFEWSAQNSVWETVIPITMKAGATTFDTSQATGTIQTIAHGLGRVPKKVKFTTNYKGTNASDASQSIGIFDGITNSCVYFLFTEGTSTAVADVVGNSSTYSLIANTGATLTDYQYGYVYFDATNIYIRWAKVGSPVNNAQILWEAE